MYVIDTNVFNWLVDGSITMDTLPSDREYVATHVQIDEINATKDVDRRAQLFLKFAEVRPRVVSTESSIWGVTRWGHGAWGSGEQYERILSALDAKNNSKKNNIQDSLIAEVALANGYTLITADKHLAEVVHHIGGDCILIEP